jgi:predicted secreted Zn-dependent protease
MDGSSAHWTWRGRVEIDSRVSTEFYPVRGTTAKEILGAMHAEARAAQAALHAADGGAVDAVGWVILRMTLPPWQPREAFGGCVVESMILEITQTTWLPRHVEPGALAPEVRTRWEAYADAVRAHEQRHVEINLEGLRAIQAEIRASRPSLRVSS